MTRLTSNRTTEMMLEHLTEEGVDGRLELVLVDRGVTAAAAHTLGRQHDLELRRVGWDDKQPAFRPIRHAWRVEVAHGRLGRSRRLAKSFENTTTSSAHRQRRERMYLRVAGISAPDGGHDVFPRAEVVAHLQRYVGNQPFCPANPKRKSQHA